MIYIWHFEFVLVSVSNKYANVIFLWWRWSWSRWVWLKNLLFSFHSSIRNGNWLFWIKWKNMYAIVVGLVLFCLELFIAQNRASSPLCYVIYGVYIRFYFILWSRVFLFLFWNYDICIKRKERKFHLIFIFYILSYMW